MNQSINLHRPNLNFPLSYFFFLMFYSSADGLTAEGESSDRYLSFSSTESFISRLSNVFHLPPSAFSARRNF